MAVNCDRGDASLPPNMTRIVPKTSAVPKLAHHDGLPSTTIISRVGVAHAVLCVCDAGDICRVSHYGKCLPGRSTIPGKSRVAHRPQVDRVWTFLPTIYSAYFALLPLWPKYTQPFLLCPYVPEELSLAATEYSPRALLMFALTVLWMFRWEHCALA